MKILKPFFGIVCLLVFATACEEQQPNFGEPPREYEAQRAVDNDSLLNFLQTRFYNYEEYATAASNEQVTFTIDTIQGDNANKTPLSDQVEEINFRIKDNDGVYFDHTAYVLKMREGVGTAPTAADSIFVAYKGMLLNLNRFDERTNPIWFESLSVVKGFSALMPYIKSAAAPTINSDGTYSHDGFGSAAIFMPSALGYYNDSRSVPAYSPLIFAVDLFTYNTTDHDGDSVPTHLEDLDGDNYFDDDTDSDGLPNFRDDDDDNDGILTRTEYDSNNDGIADDTDNDGTPDYLDKD